MTEESSAQRQSRVAVAGGSWEEYVRLYLNDKLMGKDVQVIVGKNEKQIRTRSETLWKMLSIPIKASTVRESVWGDVDLVAIKNNIPICIISCKVSLHGRLSETLFWSLLSRTLTKIKVVLATSDSGRQSGKSIWQSEWGTSDNPTKDRLLAESYLDGVYVDNVKEFCRDMKPNEHTAMGGVVRHLGELPLDLLRWSEDSKFVYTQKDLQDFH